MRYCAQRVPITCVLVLLAALTAGPAPRANAPTRGPAPSGEPTPEAERTLKRVILGLEPNETRLFMLPETAAWDPKTKDPRVRWLRRQLYRMRFELGHGQIFRSARPQTRFFVAVPDPQTTPGALGNEREVFREYLRERAGWSDSMIDERVHFFSVPVPVPYPQDMAEPIGYDGKGRLVLGLGATSTISTDRPPSLSPVAFPDDFVIRDLPDVNTEGGDLGLVRLPEGGVGLLVGHNRVVRYVERRYPGTDPRAPIPEVRIEEARRAYQSAFGGIETIVVGRETLLDPGLANPEIYHLDMLVAVLRTPSGIVAFVPTYEALPIDAHSHTPLPAEDVRRFQAQYDRTARQLAARGYRVARVPFADHPARNPVGVGKFVDPETGRPWIVLGRYPDHLGETDRGNAQTQLQLVFEALDSAVAAWRHQPTDGRWLAVQAAVASALKQMDVSVAAPNRTFDNQRRIYESFGVGVQSLPIFPTGEGGVHCLVLK